MLGDEHPGAPQRQLGSKCFRQPIVDLKQRIEDFILSPKPDTEIQLVPTLLNGLLEPSPTDKQTLIRMRILNGTYQSLKGWLIGNDVARRDFSTETAFPGNVSAGFACRGASATGGV
jgi:hypothetical protein